MTGLAGLSFFGNGKKSLDELSSFYRRLLVVGFLHIAGPWHKVQRPLGMTVLLPTVIIVFGLVIWLLVYDSCF